MVEKTQIKAVEMVRRIRDEQARLLEGKSPAEIVAFFRRAGEDARREAKQRQSVRSQSPVSRENAGKPGGKPGTATNGGPLSDKILEISKKIRLKAP